MNATLSRSDVLKPLAWLVGLLVLAVVLMLTAGAKEWALALVLYALIASVALYAFAYLFCLFKDRDALRSEKYSLHKMAMEHGLLGDSISGTFEANTIAGEGDDSRRMIDLPKIEKPE